MPGYPLVSRATVVRKEGFDLDTIADLQRSPELLKGRGYGEEDITGILHGNWVRFFREAWAK